MPGISGALPTEPGRRPKENNLNRPDFIYFDSLSEEFKSPLGAVRAGEELRLSLRLPKRSGARSPRLLVYAADRWESPLLISPMTLLRDEPAQVWYTVRFTPPAPALLFYRFDVDLGDRRASVLRGKNLFEGGMGDGFSEHWQLTVCDPEMKPPAALAGGLIYQIFPDRFFASGQPKRDVPQDRELRADWGGEPRWRPDSDGKVRCGDYFGGDLEGIRQKLPYLESLGVTALYLNPIFEAHSNHRYNTADYRKIDPLLGSEQDLRRLCAEAKACGISVILDGVFSHTGSDSVYFNREGRYGEASGAFRDPESPYRSWYRFEHYPDRYQSWWGFETLPEVDEKNPDYLRFLTGADGVIRHWMDAGVSGWRLDVADELPDEALDAICRTVRRCDPDAPVIGEVWEDASNKVSYGVRRRYLLGEQLSSVMNYPLTNAILAFIRSGDSYSLYETLLTQQENYPAPVRCALMNSLSTHDIPRAITALAGEPDAGSSREWQSAHGVLAPQDYERGARLLRLASLLQYFLPGTPCLYYGDEAGMTGYRDPFNRGCYPWGREDAGLLEWFRMLGSLRREHRELLAGADCSLVEISREICSFVRPGPLCSLFVAVNRGDAPRPLRLPPGWNPALAQVLYGPGGLGALPAGEGLILRYSAGAVLS